MSLGADCLQRPVRSRFRQRLTAGVRCGRADHTCPNMVMA